MFPCDQVFYYQGILVLLLFWEGICFPFYRGELNCVVCHVFYTLLSTWRRKAFGKDNFLGSKLQREGKIYNCSLSLSLSRFRKRKKIYSDIETWNASLFSFLFYEWNFFFFFKKDEWNLKCFSDIEALSTHIHLKRPKITFHIIKKNYN